MKIILKKDKKLTERVKIIISEISYKMIMKVRFDLDVWTLILLKWNKNAGRRYKLQEEKEDLLHM